MKIKIVLIGAGSTSFGPSMFTDLYLSKILDGSTIVLHDIDKEKLEIIYELLTIENELRNNKFIIERTKNRKEEKMAEKIFEEMAELQKGYLPAFK